MVYDADLDVALLFGDPLSEKDVRNLLEQCFSQGCATQRDGRTQQSMYLGPPTDYNFTELSLDQAIEYLTQSSGQITIWYDGLDFTFSLNTELAPKIPGVQFSLDPVFLRNNSSSEGSISEQLSKFISIIVNIYLESESIHACGESKSLDDTPVLTNDVRDLQQGCIDSIFWFNIVAPPVVKCLDKEKLLSSGYQTRELDDGSLLLILSSNPIQYNYQKERTRLEEELDL